MTREEFAEKWADTKSAELRLLEDLDSVIKSSLPPAEGAEEIDDETIAYAAEHQCGTPFSERWIGFVKGAKWLRSLAALTADKIAEERIAERMPTEEEADRKAYTACMMPNKKGEPEPDRGMYEVYMWGVNWFRSRMEGGEK